MIIEEGLLSKKIHCFYRRIIKREGKKRLDVTEFTLKLLILFFPGVLGSLVVEFLTNHKRKEWKQFLLITYVLSFISYGVYWTITKKSEFFKNLLSANWNFNTQEITSTTIIAIVISVAISIIINKKWFYHFSIWARLTDHFGNYDVWDTTLSGVTEKSEVVWVQIRNKDTKLIYQGQLFLYSSSQEDRELTLKHVELYFDDNGEIKKISEIEQAYINLSTMSNISIEIIDMK